VHRDLKDLLQSAKGQSAYVISANVDIRGFTSFFQDSIKAAVFLSGAYTSILTNYFPDVSFFKPTGDGLLLIKEVDDTDLDLMVTTIKSFIEAALKLESEFQQICASSIRMNFPKPEHIGIGLAWGDATRIFSGDKTLDYSGKPLNLASRLMDLARPYGIVFGDEIEPTFLDSQIRDQFGATDVYIKGIYEDSPMTVYTTERVIIPEVNRKPFGEERYSDPTDIQILRKIKTYGSRFSYPFKHKPSSFLGVQLHLQHPAVSKNGGKDPDLFSTFTLNPIEVKESPTGPRATFDFDAIHKRIADSGAKGTWPVQITLTYLVPKGTKAAESKPQTGTTSAGA
jgi:hypothetical protein